MKKSKKIVSSFENFVLGKFYLVPNLNRYIIEDKQSKELIDLEKVNNFILTRRVDIVNYIEKVDLELVPLIFSKKAEKGNYGVLLCSKKNVKVLPSIVISIKNVQVEDLSKFLMPCKCQTDAKCLSEEEYQAIIGWQNERRERNALKIANIDFSVETDEKQAEELPSTNSEANSEKTNKEQKNKQKKKWKKMDEQRKEINRVNANQKELMVRIIELEEENKELLLRIDILEAEKQSLEELRESDLLECRIQEKINEISSNFDQEYINDLFMFFEEIEFNDNRNDFILNHFKRIKERLEIDEKKRTNWFIIEIPQNFERIAKSI